MDMLRVRKGQIVNQRGEPVRLRGVNVGGWMNMEDFMNGFPGAEHRLRATMAEVLGEQKAHFFFERLLDHFFNEEDVAFLKSVGVNVIRLPFNYRHFERDDRPFQYLEAGFERLDRAVRWCARHGIYVILDFHAVQGWQNPDWHCDNANRLVLLWDNPHFQDRFVALWVEIARRYRGNPTVAGYDLVNEPCTRIRYVSTPYRPNWEGMNALYRRVIGAIRAVDPDHILFIEGDGFSTCFAGLDAPFDDNVVCASHHYTAPTGGPGPYPGVIQGQYWDKDALRHEFEAHEGTQYARQHNIPLFVGEFGPSYGGPAEELPDRLRAAADQIAVFEEAGAHWAMWTYKDIGEMGWVQVDPASPYLQTIQPLLRARRNFTTYGEPGAPPDSPAALLGRLEEWVNRTLTEWGSDLQVHSENFVMFIAFACISSIFQPAYARFFRDLPENEIDRILESFALRNCRPHAIVDQVIRPVLQGE